MNIRNNLYEVLIKLSSEKQKQEFLQTIFGGIRMKGNQPFIRVENVSKTYKDGEVSNKVLDNISFNVKERELVAVVGDSGSGKRRLL